MTQIHLVPKGRLWDIWPYLKEGLEVYRGKTPHYMPDDEEIFQFLSSAEGDELVLITLDRQYAGFITFKVQDLEGERWGTMAMIYLTKEAQDAGSLQEASKQLEAVFRERGCGVMNYMTARKGFRRLAPSLGFKPRIIEYMKEL